MPVITLLTDFGTHDAYAAIMKAVILKISPRTVIVDITHQIAPQDVRRAAHLLAQSYRYFPPQTIHIVVIDPGVGGSRAVVALRVAGQTFLAPDNGVLTPVIDTEEAKKIVRVENSAYFLTPVSPTFHGRDIFAPVGAHLSLGVSLDRLGAPLPGDALVRLDMAGPRRGKDGRLTGTVIDIDRFGNLITNIDWPCLRRHYPDPQPASVRFLIGAHHLDRLSRTYGSLKPGIPLVLVGSRGFFEISINQGSAADFFAATPGTPVTVWIDNTPDT
ncbi:MAG: SAM-dependent chlorinase/fluorinase [Desulfobacterales bacterium]